MTWRKSLAVALCRRGAAGPACRRPPRSTPHPASGIRHPASGTGTLKPASGTRAAASRVAAGARHAPRRWHPLPGGAHHAWIAPRGSLD